MKTLRLIRCALPLLMALQFVSVSRAADALSLDDLVALLQAGSKTEEILPELNKHGYAGATDTAALQKLKAAGADVALLLAVRKASGAVSTVVGTPATTGVKAEIKAPWGKTISLKLSDELSLKMYWVGQLGLYVGQYEVKNTAFNEYGPFSKHDKNRETAPAPAEKNLAADGKLPAATSWTQAMRFCENLTSDLKKKNPQYQGIDRWKVRLPWYSEWKVYVGDAKWEDAVTGLKFRERPEYVPGVFIPLPPGTCKANHFGLYDVLGNMAEWCLDPGASLDSNRALAGGSFLTKAPTKTGCIFESDQVDSGFRCVLAATMDNAAPTATSDPAPEAEEELPYGSAIAGRPGFVNSPYAEKFQVIDVTGLPTDLEIKCPYTGKLFRVPQQ